MERRLLRYRPVDDFYKDWLDRIAELVSAVGGSPAPSLSLPCPPPAAGDVAHGAPPPPPRQDVFLRPRCAAPWRDRPRRAPAACCVRLKIPKVSDEAIILAFSDGVRDVKMKAELAIHEELCTALEMFNMATKCARAEEGRLSLQELSGTDLEDKKAKLKDVKRKGLAVLAAEPEMKRDCDHPESSKGSRPFSVFQNMHNHNTNDCQELRAVHDGRLSRRPERNDRGHGCGGGRGGGRWDDRGPCQEWCDQPREERWQAQPHEGAWRDQPREDRPQGNAGLPSLSPPPRRNDDHHQDKGAGGF
ncbi:uncharacterized protein [Aegilops tauschii subsp. strangulata]|uniref:uncharacterized protein n=1 Tax=Triticum aestivum TaxID=4565 RepID=UPI001D01A763|nr:uncharacterized protein LOC123144579 [Triticum aestivum]XP_044419721.1 uncharacterized protein LOC123144579 [Triticum aestivum]XP_045085825.1 uncharacterized protein LOC109749490 [Aegilops tauschii subsp. strangulata]XP_045085826.1 uncharacterized protein LOC109749490 [Aegilops tauschii subsp. strangulata]